MEFIDSCDGVRALESDWRAMERHAAAPSLFLAFDWVYPWLTAFATPGSIRVAVLRKGGRIRALAAFLLTTERLGPFPTRTLRLLHNQYSTRADVLCAQDDLDAAGALLAAVLQCAGDWSVIELRDVSASSPTLPSLRRCIDERHMAAEIFPSSMRTPILVCDGTWQTYHDGRSRNFRRNLRRARAKLESRGTVEIQSYDTPETASAGLRILSAIEAAGWKGAEGTALGTEPIAQAFFADVIGRFAERGALDLSVLHVDGVPAAACLAIRYADIVYGLKVSFDPTFAEGSPGLGLALAMMERQWTSATQAFDMVQTSSFPADRLTDRFDERLRLRIFTNGLYGKLLGTLKLGFRRGLPAVPPAS